MGLQLNGHFFLRVGVCERGGVGGFLDRGVGSGRCRCVGTLDLVMQLTPHPPSALQTEGTDGRAPRRG